jgi:hypothetical protein
MTISPPERGEFETAIRRTVERFKPQNVIETGTYLGNGTTRILFEALKEYSPYFTLVTIESKYEYYKVASAHYRNYPEVVCLHGLTIPRSQLPTLEEIQRETVENEVPGIYHDHSKDTRAALYFQEQQTDGPDGLLGIALNALACKPDLVLLDSAGHLGFREFTFLMSMVKAPFVLIADDARHVKHHQTFVSIHTDLRWEMLGMGDERFGWFAARFKG